MISGQSVIGNHRIIAWRILNKTNNMLKIWLDNKIIDDPMYKGCTKMY